MPTSEELQQERIKNMIEEFEKVFGVIKKKGSTAPDTKLPSGPLSMKRFGDRRTKQYLTVSNVMNIVTNVKGAIKEEVSKEVMRKYDKLIKEEIELKLKKVDRKV